MRLTLLFFLLASNCGAQWTIQSSGTTSDLRGIHAVSAQIAWASGSHGTILHTIDGGTHWLLCPTPPDAEKLDFRGIQAFDAQTAIVMSSGKGNLSRLYKTTDACQTWKLVFTNPDKEGFWDALHFDDLFGYILGDPVRGAFYLARSSDGGKTWIRQTNKGLTADAAAQGAFAASNSSMLVGRGGPIFGSGGKAGAMIYMESSVVICLDDCPPSEMNLDGSKNTWIHQLLPIGNRSESSGIFALSGRRNHGPDTKDVVTSHKETAAIVAVGGDYQQPDESATTAALTPDGGKSWTSSTTSPHGYRSAVAFNPDNQSWITVGPNGTDISTDDGRNWHALKPGPNDPPDADQHWNALSLPFVVGPHGRIGILAP